MEQIKQFDGLFNQIGKTFLLGKTGPTDVVNGKMNIVALLTCNANKADDVLTMKEVQGSVNYKGYTLDRMNTSVAGGQIHTIMGVAAAPIFSFGDSVYYFNGAGVSSLTASDATMEMLGKAATAEYFSFHMGGVSVMFELGAFAVA